MNSRMQCTALARNSLGASEKGTALLLVRGEAGTKPSIELSLEMLFVARLPSLFAYALC